MKNMNTVAIVGIGCVFPGSPNYNLFWNNIINRVNTSIEAPVGRWPLSTDEVYHPAKGMPDRLYSKKACFIENFQFDPTGIDLEPDFLKQLDPMYLMGLHAAREALKDSLHPIKNRERVGVIIGNIALPTEKSSQLAMQYLGRTIEEKITGNYKSAQYNDVNPINRFVAGLPAGLIASGLGLGGGSYTLDAACASSLYALSLAADELVAGRSDAMLAGGLSRPDSFYTQMGFSQLHALSPTGVSSPFDEKANGLVVGEGAGILLLKRLTDALRDGDQIYACIKGSGLSNDVGGGMLAPNSDGQIRAMEAAYKNAGWDPTDVDLIECHATGTPKGDSVEFNSLMKLWENGKWKKSQCKIGSVKSNIGHLLTAAGSAGIIKMLLSMKHQILPPTANFSKPAKGLNFEESPFSVIQEPVRWERRGDKISRKAAVSAFGFGGINAHILLEEWAPELSTKKKTKKKTAEKPDIAIVGMDADFGQWDSLPAFKERVLGRERKTRELLNAKWYGAEVSEWYKEKFKNEEMFKGYYKDTLSISLKKYRIPPKEIEEMQPQQLLMLKVATGAIEEAKIDGDDLLHTGVFIGIGLDLNTTNFHVRWCMAPKAKEWAKRAGISLSENELNNWIIELRNSINLPLTANSTIGSLGSIVASRIAREFHIGGPSFTISSEETSGLQALETAIRLLQKGTIKQAIVGAVDFTGDIRSVIGVDASRQFSGSNNVRPFDKQSDGTVLGEGAVALCLKPLSSAIKYKDKIYAVIKEVGGASGGDIQKQIPYKKTILQAMARAYSDSKIDPNLLGMLETNGSGLCAEDDLESDALSDFFNDKSELRHIAVNSVKGDIGHTGAASGLASVAKCALALSNEIIPGLRGFEEAKNEALLKKGGFYYPLSSQYWLRNRADGARKAGVTGFSMDGNAKHVVLESFDQTPIDSEKNITLVAGELQYALFLLQADSDDKLKDLAEKLAHQTASFDDVVEKLASMWYLKNPYDKSKKITISIVIPDKNRLLNHLETVKNENFSSITDLITISKWASQGLFFSPSPLKFKGDIAFVYPGTGNQFSGMAKELSVGFPQLLKREDLETGYLKNQFAPEVFWNGDATKNIFEDTGKALFGQVSIGHFITDILSNFGLTPNRIIGYSLGESTAFFSLKVWNDKDEMYSRIKESSIFKDDLTGKFLAVRKRWNLTPEEPVDWLAGVIKCSGQTILDAINSRECRDNDVGAGSKPAHVLNAPRSKRVYLLIVNTPSECIIGGEKNEVQSLVEELKASFIPLQGVFATHCEIVKEISKEYKDFHTFSTRTPKDIRFYNSAKGSTYEINPENAASSILSSATDGFDFPKLINKAYSDGVRIFIEIGPGASCSRMISEILGDKPHMARSVCVQGRDSYESLLFLLGRLLAEGVSVNLEPLYGKDRFTLLEQSKKESDNTLISVVRNAFELPPIPVHKKSREDETTQQCRDSSPKSPFLQAADKADNEGAQLNTNWNYNTSSNITKTSNASLSFISHQEELVESIAQTSQIVANAHETYLKLSNNMAKAMESNILRQLSIVKGLTSSDGISSKLINKFMHTEINDEEIPERKVFMDRTKCLEFAIGKIGSVLGEEFSQIDTHPTRVRLPDEPLMLVDRIISVEGIPKSLGSGRVITEHDIHPGAWYLDCNKIPTCIAVEAGQADLFLSGYLGIDFKTGGDAMYRLLDAVVTFHREMPGPGETIKYDIKIERFFRQGETYLFRFNFEGTIGGEIFITMKEGCAGFFTQKELDAGKGIVKSALEKKRESEFISEKFEDIIPIEKEAYSTEKLNLLRNGDLAGCFGVLFKELQINNPETIPSGKMNLVHRITSLDPKGGTYKQGLIIGEADIHPDDWFLTCHFSDDMVMPGTLMYECCMHTLRVFLLRMGFVGEKGEVSYDPVPGVGSRLKCRGQVIQTTKTATYEISIKKIGYMPEPYVIADAILYSDKKAIVEISDMSILIKGLTREKVMEIWHSKNSIKKDEKVIFDQKSILDFAIGNPSDAFGAQYKVFDKDRIIARLPGPPYMFLDGVIKTNCPQWKMVSGGEIEAIYKIPSDAWYFKSHRQQTMPFAVLLEVALQPCGWFAAYMGSALTSDIDLSFRNLGGEAVQYEPIFPNSGTLTTTVKSTKVSQSVGMIIQHYDFTVRCNERVVYKGNTYFGFFSKDALKQQIGIRDAALYNPTDSDISNSKKFNYPDSPPFPDETLRMVDRINIFSPHGGTNKLGFIQGAKIVNPAEWFFKAHFYQDPVCPGSLGLESFLQLLKVVANERWGDDLKCESMILNQKHNWIYRGQILPVDKEVNVQAVVTDINDEKREIKANGYLSVDGRVIYQMVDFGVQFIFN